MLDQYWLYSVVPRYLGLYNTDTDQATLVPVAGIEHCLQCWRCSLICSIMYCSVEGKGLFPPIRPPRSPEPNGKTELDSISTDKQQQPERNEIFLLCGFFVVATEIQTDRTAAMVKIRVKVVDITGCRECTAAVLTDAAGRIQHAVVSATLAMTCGADADSVSHA